MEHNHTLIWVSTSCSFHISENLAIDFLTLLDSNLYILQNQLKIKTYYLNIIDFLLKTIDTSNKKTIYT